MKLTVNGDRHEVPEGLTITALLAHLGVRTDRVAVEVNQTVLPRAKHPAHLLSEGDVVEVVTFVGGG